MFTPFNHCEASRSIVLVAHELLVFLAFFLLCSSSVTTRFLQNHRLCAMSSSSSNNLWPGASWNIPFVDLRDLCSCNPSRSLAIATLLGKCVPFSRSRCFAQVSLLALILAKISNDGTKYSSLISLFVMDESLLAFQAPIHLVTFSEIGQASQPYTRTESTAAAYSLNLSTVMAVARAGGSSGCGGVDGSDNGLGWCVDGNSGGSA